MSKEQLVKKAGLYTILLAAGTLFIYFSLSAALYPFSEKLDQLPSGSKVSELIAQGIMLPLVFAILSLAILGLVQFLLHKPESATEKRIYAGLLIFFFGLGLAMTIVVLVGAFKNAALATIYGSIPSFVICLAEILFGILRFVGANRLLAEENKAENS